MDNASERRLARGCILLGLIAAGWVMGCEGAPVGIAAEEEEEEEEVAPPPAAPVELPAGAVIDLGSEVPPSQPLSGFSPPERVGERLASWSDGELSKIGFDVHGGADRYLVAFLAEPYHMLGEVPLRVSLNGRPLMEASLANGWRGYRAVVAGDRIVAGRNQLAFHYAKRGRPSDFNTASSDLRDLSVRFDQVQVQPITGRAELSFGSKNALALAALGEGWAHDPNDRGTGTWTIASRALITFHVQPPAAPPAGNAPGGAGAPPTYQLSISARTPRGVPERSVSLELNGAPLGQLSFHEAKAVGVVDVPAERLKGENELALRFARLVSPAQLDPSSKDARLLGLRVFELQVAPRGAAPSDQPPAVAAPSLVPGPSAPPASTTARERPAAEARK